MRGMISCVKAPSSSATDSSGYGLSSLSLAVPSRSPATSSPAPTSPARWRATRGTFCAKKYQRREIIKMNCGVYVISDPEGGQYVGSSINISRRKGTHKFALRNNAHKSKTLQAAYNQHGYVKYVILLICSPSDLLMYEQRAFDVLKPIHNTCPLAGSSLGVKRGPQSIEVRLKKSAALLGIKRGPHTLKAREKMASAWSRLTKEERSERIKNAWKTRRNR